MKLEDCFFNMPGRIVEYFPSTQTATVRICVERNFDSANELGSSTARGLLTDVPVHTCSGGGWALTHPIKPKDTCIIFFSQIGYDHWLFDNKDEAGLYKGQPMFWTERKFDVQDGYALVGLNTLPQAIPSYHSTDSEWRNIDRDQRISLKADGNIHIKTGTTTINMAPSGAITVHTDASLDITADASTTLTSPEVTVNCITATVNAATNAKFITPVLAISGNLIVGGGIAAGTPVPPTGALPPVPAGLSLSGPANITGVVTSEADVIAGTVSLQSHTHLSPGNVLPVVTGVPSI